MNDLGTRPLFVDTGAFYARADDDDVHHETANRIFEGIRTGELPFRPLFTSQAVLAELATLLLYKLGHAVAARELTKIWSSNSFNVVPVGKPCFETAIDQFVSYDDQDISFVDHSSGILAAERDIDHVFAFDSDFRTLGFSLVPEDVSY